MKRILLVVLTIFLLGCVSKIGKLRQVSAGHIGCSHNNITILDHKSDFWGNSKTWIAICKGKRFICSKYWTGGDTIDIKCIREIE